MIQQHGPNAPIDDLDANGCTPLMYAAMADSRLAIEMLLNFSARREQVHRWYIRTEFQMEASNAAKKLESSSSLIGISLRSDYPSAHQFLHPMLHIR